MHELVAHAAPEDVVWFELLPAAATVVVNQARLFGEAIDFFLSETGQGYLPELTRLCKLDTPEAEKQILH